MKKQQAVSSLFFGLIVLVALFALAGCKPEPVVFAPPEIRYGEDICDACNMVIDDPRFAAAIQLANGEYLKFDDTGDMVFHAKTVDEEILGYWVHDYYTEDWLNAVEAFFVQSDSLNSPMGHGLAAFANQDVADRFASELMTTVLTFAEVQASEHGMKMEH